MTVSSEPPRWNTDEARYLVKMAWQRGWFTLRNDCKAMEQLIDEETTRRHRKARRERKKRLLAREAMA